MKAIIIGLGRIGFENSLDKKRVQPASHLGCYAELLKPENVGFCDTDHAKLNQALDWMPLTGYACTDYEELLGEFEPDIVSICVPTPSHRKIACTVAEHDCVKTIFLEKPIAQSLDEADEIIKVCEENKIDLVVDYSRRWSWMYPHAKSMIQAAIIGKVVSIIGCYAGPLLRTGTHMLDVFDMLVLKHNHLKNPVATAQAFGEAHDNYLTTKTDSNDFNLNAHISYVGGPEATLIAGKSREYLVFEIDVFGEGGRMRITQNGSAMTLYNRFESYRYSGINELQMTLKERRLDYESMLFNAVRDVFFTTVDNILAAKEKNPTRCRFPCIGRDARRVLQTALAIHYSYTHGCSIIVPETLPKDYAVKTY